MKNKKKIYTAPSAELILLAPMEPLATLTDESLAMNQWGQPVVKNASIVGSNSTYWNEDGTITQSTGGN